LEDSRKRTREKNILLSRRKVTKSLRFREGRIASRKSYRVRHRRQSLQYTFLRQHPLLMPMLPISNGKISKKYAIARI